LRLNQVADDQQSYQCGYLLALFRLRQRVERRQAAGRVGQFAAMAVSSLTSCLGAIRFRRAPLLQWRNIATGRLNSLTSRQDHRTCYKHNRSVEQ